MAFPTSHKTVFLMDHMLTTSSGVRLEMDAFSKPKSGQQNPAHFMPLLPVTKSLWTCAVEAITEYCRIVWDIFPGTKLIRFLAVDNIEHRVNSWAIDQQNLTVLMNAFMGLGPAKAGNKADLFRGFHSAIEMLAEITPTQQQKLAEVGGQFEGNKIANKGRVILITNLESEEEVRMIRERFQETLIQVNKMVSATKKKVGGSNDDQFIPVNHCDLVVLNFCHSDFEPRGRVLQEVSPILSFEVSHIVCGNSLAPKLCSLILRHYDLASTTVTGIPMKEEQNASSSANYDVELFHPAAAHTAILKGIPTETAHLRTVREGTDYETVTLKWCTPRSNSSNELQHCTSAYRITSVDVISRPSSCLTNFLLNGRWVMLEMPRKSGSKVISHMLASHGGDIYIHTLYTARSILEDPPSISEGCGGRVTDYRIHDFGDLIKANMLAPQPDTKETSPLTPNELSKERLKRHTKFWPITLSSTSLFVLGPQIDPLTTLMPKNTLSEDDIIECKKVIYLLMNLEANGEPLPTATTGQRGKSAKREEQYKAMWLELEQYLKCHLHSQGHKDVLNCLMECQNKNQPQNKEEQVDIDQALKELDHYNCLTHREKTEFNSQGNHKDQNEAYPNTKRQKTTHSIQQGRGTKGVNLLALWSNKVTSEQMGRSREFKGRLDSPGNVAQLYTALQQKERGEKEESTARPKIKGV